MGCSCVVDTYDGDSGPVSLYNRKIVQARKSHKCGECGCEITSGEKYETLSFLFEGKFWRDKTCTDCISAQQQFFPHGGYCSGAMWEEIKEYVSASYGEIPESCISCLAPVAKDKVCGFVQNVIQST